MYAHYFANGTERYIIISDTMQPIGDKIPVASRLEAKRIAQEMNATCWNF